jgi:hypothetical protein
MNSSPSRIVFTLISAAVVLAGTAAAEPGRGLTKDQAALVAAPAPDQIPAELLAPAVRQAVANGAATLVARITAEGNDHGLAFPPTQTTKFLEMVEIPAKRVPYEEPIYRDEYAMVEKIVPVLENGEPTGRFKKVSEKIRVKRTQIGTRSKERLVRDPDGKEMMKVPTYGPGGPAAWYPNLPGLNGMALYVLAKAGLGTHPATVKHAEALAEHCGLFLGLPDATFDLAWMAAGFVALGDARYEALTERLLDKLIDGQIQEKGATQGLWGPVCVNYGHYGKLFMLGQTVRHEVEVLLPEKMDRATPAQQAQLKAMEKAMREVAKDYERIHRDVFRCGTQMDKIVKFFSLDDDMVVPGLPLNAYRWVAADVESTEAALFALAEAKRAGVLPRETKRLAIRGKKIHPPVKTENVLAAAGKRLASAIAPDGGCSALAAVAPQTGFQKTGFPTPPQLDEQPPQSPFDVESACACVAGGAAIESLLEADPDLAKQLDEPWSRSRARIAAIAARWYAESVDTRAEPWKGIYHGLKISHADLKKSAALPFPEQQADAVESLPWGPSGSLYQIVPGFRSLFAEATSPVERLDNDLFRQVAYRLVTLQDGNGQWKNNGSLAMSTATESLMIGNLANHWHWTLNVDPPRPLNIPDPISYETMLLQTHWNTQRGEWVPNQARRPDPGAFPTLASLVFLVAAIDSPVSLEGITILPEAETDGETNAEADPAKEAVAEKPRLQPIDAVVKVARPSEPRDNLYGAIGSLKSPQKAPAAESKPAEGKAVDNTPAATQPADEPEPDKDLGTFEDLLKVPDAAN